MGLAKEHRQWVVRAVWLAIGAASIYLLAPTLASVWAEAPRAAEIGWLGLAGMTVAKVLSLVCTWDLHRLSVRVGWFTAATTQLTANAASRVVPAGAAVGGTVTYKMWSAAGLSAGAAGTALAVTSVLQTVTLAALPVVSLVVASFGFPVPHNLAVVAFGGAALAVVLMAAGAVFVRSERVVRAVAGLVIRVKGSITRDPVTDPDAVDRFVAQRDEVLQILGPRWPRALAVATGIWVFDYLILVAALAALGTNPRLSLVLLAYSAAAVLAMIPITPGGLGFVEAGLTSLLVVSGIPADDALLATFGYRLVSFWLPLPAGLVAWRTFRRRYPSTLDLDALTTS